jgi:hypothetical protein
VIETAGHLPGLPAGEVAWRTLDFSAWGERVQVRVPELTAAQAGALAGHVREQARTYLRTLPVAQIVATLDAAIARLLDRDDPWRRRAEAVLPIVTGYDRESVRLGLSGYLRSFRAPQLQRFLAEDFANPAVLDGFQPAMKGGFTRAQGPQLLLHIWAGNVPGLSLWSLICGVLVKAGTVGKVASAEPLLAGWFAQILAEIDPQLGECLAVVWWKGGDAEAERAWLNQADTIVAYGGNDALAAIRERVPVTARFLPHGHRIGFGLIGAEALDTRRAGPLARLVAQDVARWEQQGCYSPQMLFVARGGAVSPREFAERVSQELGALSLRHPRRALCVAEAAGVAAWRSREEMRGFDEDGTVVLGEAGDGWSVVFSDAAQPLAPSALNRTLKIVAVDSLDAVPALVSPSRAYLQTAAVAASPRELFRIAALLGDAGVTRICGFGAMAAPEAGWHNDGRFNLLDLVRLTEIEQSAERAADDLAPYVD